MKSHFLSIVLGLLLMTIAVDSGEHLRAVVFGKRSPSDVRIFAEMITTSAHFFDTSKATLLFPHYLEYNPYIISSIVVIDKNPNGNSGTVNLVNGGVGHTNARLVFNSEKSGAIRQTVEIYSLLEDERNKPKS